MSTSKSTHQLLVEVTKWASEAAREHVELAIFRNETPDPETGMGLWQSFVAKFPPPPDGHIAFPSSTYVDRELIVNALTTVYSTTVKTLMSFRPDGGRADFERTQGAA